MSGDHQFFDQNVMPSEEKKTFWFFHRLSKLLDFLQGTPLLFHRGRVAPGFVTLTSHSNSIVIGSWFEPVSSPTFQDTLLAIEEGARKRSGSSQLLWLCWCTCSSRRVIRLSCCFLPVRVAAPLVARVLTDAAAGGLLVGHTGAMLLSTLHTGGSFERHAAPTAHCLSLSRSSGAPGAPVFPASFRSGRLLLHRGQDSSKSLCCLFSAHCNWLVCGRPHYTPVRGTQGGWCPTLKSGDSCRKPGLGLHVAS